MGSVIWQDAGFGRVELDDGVATIVIQMPGRANRIDAAFGQGLAAAWAAAKGASGVVGVVITSGHKDFCVGGDIDTLYAATSPARMLEGSLALHGLLRDLETAGVPVVAALNGSALGGGFELALACHRRIVVDGPKVRVGLPEVMIGLFPGMGGCVRLPRLVGPQAALEIILQGQSLRVEKALEKGLVHSVVADADALAAEARAWILANPRPRQPWDAGDERRPRPGSEDATGLFTVASAMLYQKTAGAVAAPKAALLAVAEGWNLTFQAALQNEARRFAAIATSGEAKDMIRLMWYHRTACERQDGLPRVEEHGFSRVCVLGAGMMGSGIAWLCAQAGLDVVVKDIAADALQRCRDHLEQQAAKAMRHASAEQRAAVLGRVSTTLEDAGCAGCDLVVEAVAESATVKHAVTRAIEPHLAPGAVWASNTSAIPITLLATASAHPQRFIGAHFFSPAEVMPLLEVIVGEQTDEATLARLLAFARAIGKTVIVVNDGYAFYTSRVFSAYVIEGAQLVAEGHDPAVVEWAARSAGFPVAPLKVMDEVSLALMAKAGGEAAKHGADPDLAGMRLLRSLVERGRTGKAGGAGWYDYLGKERTLWPGLRELVTAHPDRTGVDVIRERLLLAQVVQAVTCLETGILQRRRDAEVGAVFGVGFAPQTGGPLAWVDRQGVDRVVARLRELTASAGPRFSPPALLVGMAERGERFFPEGEPPR